MCHCRYTSNLKIRGAPVAERPEQKIQSEIDCLRPAAAGRRGRSHRNLAVNKPLKQVLSRCEWGHDDDSRQVENQLQKPPERGQQGLFGDEPQ